MAWDTSELRQRFSKPGNSDAVQYLANHHPSAHSDLADELFTAAGPARANKFFCPNGSSYAYVLLHTDADVIYAVAIGMKQIAFRLPTVSLIAALAAGGEAAQVIGTNWISFPIFLRKSDISLERARLKHWCGIAAAHADAVPDENSLQHPS